MKSSSCLRHVVALCASLFGVLEHAVLAAPADGLSIFVATGKPPANSLADSISETGTDPFQRFMGKACAAIDDYRGLVKILRGLERWTVPISRIISR